jgi:16S rRNA (guanine966-N2)-methyltransferase
MRIVGGTWAGRDLTSPGGRTRPTSEAVRAAWMSMLEPRLHGARVLDLFAGTGALGLEALSRGASRVDFVENGAPALHSLKANVAALRVRNRVRVFKRDAIPFVDMLDADAYDVAFVDPPYGSRMADRVVRTWADKGFAAILAVEHAADHELPPGGRRLQFAETAVTVYPAGALDGLQVPRPVPPSQSEATHVTQRRRPPRRRR